MKGNFILGEIDEKIRLIRSKMDDDVSTNIFDAYINNIYKGGWMFAAKFDAELTDCVDKFDKLYFLTGNLMDGWKQNFIDLKKRYVVFGTGVDGIHNLMMLKKAGVKVSFCVDSVEYRKKEIVIDNTKYQILPVDAVVSNDEYILISSSKYKEEMKHQLLKMGIEEERIISAGNIQGIKGGQYFEVFSPCNDEIFVDAGGYDGDTVIEFSKWSRGKYRKIYVFEPEHNNMLNLKVNLEKNNIDRVSLFEAGLSDENGERALNFAEQRSGFSDYFINGNSNQFVKVYKLDDIVKNRDCTFIKMDIEGAELDALHGGVETIKNKRPRMAISVYHRFYDMIAIPEYLLSLVPEYKFLLRHYTNVAQETVLYAWTD